MAVVVSTVAVEVVEQVLQRGLLELCSLYGPGLEIDLKESESAAIAE